LNTELPMPGRERLSPWLIAMIISLVGMAIYTVLH
jgi:hypothetical protein